MKVEQTKVPENESWRFFGASGLDRCNWVRLNIIRGRFGFDSRDLKFAALVLWSNHLDERVVRGRMPSLSYTEDMLPPNDT